jgi:hypothetical protein
MLLAPLINIKWKISQNIQIRVALNEKKCKITLHYILTHTYLFCYHYRNKINIVLIEMVTIYLV